MKKLLLSLPLILCTLNANSQTQIGNSDFELWEPVTDEINKPENWNGLMTVDAVGIYSSMRRQQIQRVTDARPGSSGTRSVKIWTVNVPALGINTTGTVTTGRFRYGSTTMNHIDNYAKSFQSDSYYSEAFIDTPDSVVFWVKYLPTTPSPTLTAKASFIIHKNLPTGDYKDPNDLASTNTVATAITDIAYNAGNWQRISVPFNYVASPSEGAFILGTFRTCSLPGGGEAMDELRIDDIELVYVPRATFTTSGTSVCPGGSLNFTSTSTNYATSYSWDFGDGSANSTDQNPSHTFTTAGTYDVTLTATNQWGSTTSTVTTITVDSPSDASLTYAQSSYCLDDTDPTPVVTNPGTFSSTTGLVINSTTGQIDLSGSTPGTYTVSNFYNGSCPNTETTSVTINPAANAAFSYALTTVCSTSANVTPTVSETGVFSVYPATGLVFANTSTGEIDVTNSTAGTYTILHTVAGTIACPTSSSTNNVTFTIVSLSDASFSYANTSYCANATDPSPVLASGAIAGTYTATSGLVINSSSGVIDLSASTPGNHTVTNTIPFTGTCPAVSETATITVNELPIVSLPAFGNLCANNSPIVLSGGTPTGGTYSGNGVTAGSFDPSVVNPGVIVISYSYTDPTTNCTHSTVNSINVDACLGLDNSEMNSITAYPNPTNGKVTIDNFIGSATFSVVSISGQIVLEGTISTSLNTIDLSSFETGIYVIQLNKADKIHSIRVIKN